MKEGGEKDALKLDMGLGEALRRFIQTDPAQLADTTKVVRAAKARALERTRKADTKTDSAVAGKDENKVGESAKRRALTAIAPRKDKTS